MTRPHRAWHRLIWPVLLVAVGVGFTLALTRRAPAAPLGPAAVEASR